MDRIIKKLLRSTKLNEEIIYEIQANIQEECTVELCDNTSDISYEEEYYSTNTDKYCSKSLQK